MAKTYQWYYDGSLIGGATAKTHTLTSGQTDSNLIECRVDADFGADEVAALAKYGAAAGPSYSAISYQESSTNTASPSFTVDMSSYGSGDTVYVAYGAIQNVTAVTYDGNAMTQVVNTNGGTGGQRASIWKYTLTGTGGATDAFAFTLAASTNQHNFQGFVTDGTDEDSGALGNNASTTAITLTPTSSTNIAWCVGTAGGTPTDVTWTNGTEVAVQDPAITNKIVSTTKDDNVSTGGVTITMTNVGWVSGDDNAVVGVVVA